MENANPYPDWRTISHGHVTWSRAFRTAWRDGWDKAAAEAAARQSDVEGIS